MNSADLVRNYFNREARRFDAIYERDKPLLERLTDYAFRRVVVERFQLICNLARPTSSSWSVLDVGCGSGRYSIALAGAGASRVVGIDIAASMIDLATAEAARARVVDRCTFQTAAFLEAAVDGSFDVVVATGYFDYVEDPVPHLRKMVRMCRGKVFASFPKRWEVRVPIRKLRFALAQGFVRFYSRREVLTLAAAADIAAERTSLIDLGRDWILVSHVGH